MLTLESKYAQASSGSASSSFTRAGKGVSEHLLQRVFLKRFDAAGGPLSATELFTPRPLTQGKKAVDLFAVTQVAEDL